MLTYHVDRTQPEYLSGKVNADAFTPDSKMLDVQHIEATVPVEDFTDGIEFGNSSRFSLSALRG